MVLADPAKTPEYLGPAWYVTFRNRKVGNSAIAWGNLLDLLVYVLIWVAMIGMVIFFMPLMNYFAPNSFMIPLAAFMGILIYFAILTGRLIERRNESLTYWAMVDFPDM